jgi:hypothetical protein
MAMTKWEATCYLKWCALYKIPIHPDRVKKLCKIAEVPVPEDLKPVDYTAEERVAVDRLIENIEKGLFGVE